ncbi:MAG: hypothetical protein ACRDFB_02245 [Rhabdochlamydiaceae bacterium]
MSNSDKVSVDEMLRALEHYGVKREMLEKLHPSPETIMHLYSSIEKQRHVSDFSDSGKNSKKYL